MWFTSQPANATATTSGYPVAFAVGAATDSATTRSCLQRDKNGGPIAGATGATLVYRPTGSGDNGAQFFCAVRSLGFADAGGNLIWSNSAVALLNYNETTAPALTYSAYFLNTNVIGYGPAVSAMPCRGCRVQRAHGCGALLAATYTIAGVTVTTKTVNSNNYSDC